MDVYTARYNGSMTAANSHDTYRKTCDHITKQSYPATDLKPFIGGEASRNLELKVGTRRDAAQPFTAQLAKNIGLGIWASPVLDG